jgi:arylsulfatase A-like enzyme/predicted neuraminidase
MKTARTLPCLLLAILIGDIATGYSTTKPNIIFLMADDLGYGDPGCYGGKTIATPNIDRLARQGLRFTQAYSGGPVCTPARSVLMTGLHNGHTPARDNVPHYRTYLVDQDVTVAEILKTAGYRCGGIGKWSLGDAGSEGGATRQGFDSWFGYLNQDHAHYYHPEYLDDDNGRLALNGNTTSRRHYSHELLTERALEFIRESKDGPFFFYGAYALPHFSAKDEDRDGFTVPSTQPYTDRDWDEKSKKYAAMVHLLDRDVGRITDLVDELGLSENTLIIFTSDNGGHKTIHRRFNTSGPLRGFKRELTEGGIRVPFIMRWPGHTPAGKTSHEVIAFQDMLPTFAALAGIPPGTPVDGINVGSALTGGTLESKRDHLYWDYGHCRGRQYAQAVRLGDWKGIRAVKNGNQMELYDLANDIGETKDLARQNPQIVRRIATIMDEAVTPDDRYAIGTTYRGKAIWRKPGPFVKTSHPIPPLSKPGTGGYVAAEHIFAPDDRPTPQCHSSTIVEATDGNLVTAWFGGTIERHIDNSIWVSRRLHGKWSDPIAVVDGSEGEQSDHRTGNPVLFQPRNGPLMLFYKVVPTDNSRASQWWGMLTTSPDGGRSWAKPWRLGTDAALGSRPHLIGPVKNSPIQLPDGTIICPSSTEHEGWRVHFELTRDFGRTWQVIGPINDASRFNAIQPSILRHGKDRWQVLCRSREGVIAESRSADGGRTWGPFNATELPNPNSGTAAVTLKDGRHLLVYNHTVRGGNFPSGRNLLNVAISTDGNSWRPALTLERAKSEFSYPFVIQSSEGRVHLTYTYRRDTIKHVTLDPAALR